MSKFQSCCYGWPLGVVQGCLVLPKTGYGRLNDLLPKLYKCKNKIALLSLNFDFYGYTFYYGNGHRDFRKVSVEKSYTPMMVLTIVLKSGLFSTDTQLGVIH